MNKNRLFLLICILTLTSLFGISASCSMCGINFTTDATAPATAESDEGESVAGSAEETSEEIETEDTAQETASESSQTGRLFDISKLVAVFSIANDPGNKLITFYSDANETVLKEINQAIGEDGKCYTVEYDKKQSSNDQDTFRVVADNFDNMEGHLYNATGENPLTDNTYFLCRSDILNQDNLLDPVSTGVEDLDQDTKTQIENIKGRNVQDGWTIDEYSDGTRILVAVFEPDGNNYLMCIGLKKDIDVKLIDFPATFDGYSAWRVDDGGVIDPRFFKIIFTAQTTQGLLTNLSWVGAEGHSIFFLLEKTDIMERLPIDASRYTSPG